MDGKTLKAKREDVLRILNSKKAAVEPFYLVVVSLNLYTMKETFVDIELFKIM